MRAVIYVRISNDKTGQAVGVADQQKDCQIIAERLGAQVICVLSDNDISASKFSRKTRPAYTQLIGMIRANAVDVVIAWHSDRLYRQPTELEDLVRLIDEHHVRIETFRAGVVDLSTAAGRMQARNLGTYSAYESEIKSERIRARLKYKAQDGLPHGQETYGWTRIRNPDGNPADVINPAEARVIRRIAGTVLAGESVHRLVKELIAEGVPTARGGTWTPAAVRSLVQRPRNAGLRTHQGKVVADGTWVPILERDAWERVCAILSDPTRNVSPGPEPAHLLSGIAVCSECGSGLRALKVGTTPSYKCPRFCVSRNRPDTDRWVTQNMIAFLLDPDAVHITQSAPAGDSGKASAELETVRAKLDLAASQWAEGVIDDRQLAVITASLRPRMEQAQAAIAATSAPSAFEGMTGTDAATLQANWESASIRRRRAMVDQAFIIRVHPIGGGRRPFDEASVSVVKRGRPK